MAVEYQTVGASGTPADDAALNVHAADGWMVHTMFEPGVYLMERGRVLSKPDMTQPPRAAPKL